MTDHLKTRILTLACSLLLSAGANLALAQALPMRFPVQAERILAAMAVSRLPVEQSTVRLAAEITATVRDPQLQIQSISRTSSHDAQLRVACLHRAECLPFFANVSWQPSGSTTQSTEAPTSAPTTRPAPSSDLPQSLRAGTPVMLAIDSDKVHIRMQVICLQSGTPGEKIRVRSRETQRTFEAEIVSPTLLKGTL